MPQDIFSRRFWTTRIKRAMRRKEPFRSVFEFTHDRMEEVETAQRLVLARYVESITSILDVGCGYGRLLHLLPETWHGDYLGFDLVPEFVSMAKSYHPQHQFILADCRTLVLSRKYDLGICASFKPMILSNTDIATWAKMHSRLKLYTERLLYLEMDPDDKGAIE